MPYVIKDNKCLQELQDAVPEITSGTTLPQNTEGKEGDVFILLEDGD